MILQGSTKGLGPLACDRLFLPGVRLDEGGTSPASAMLLAGASLVSCRGGGRGGRGGAGAILAAVLVATSAGGMELPRRCGFGGALALSLRLARTASPLGSLGSDSGIGDSGFRKLTPPDCAGLC